MSERVNRYELSPRLAADLRMTGMRICGCDVVIFINDVFSKNKDAAAGDVFNIVFLLEQLQGCGRAAAIEKTIQRQHETVKRYLHLRSLLLENDLPPHERDVALQHAFDIEHWMSGSLDWHVLDAVDRHDVTGA